MTETEALHRAWVMYGEAAILLGVAIVQLWTGKTLMPGGRIVSRSRESSGSA